MASIAASAISSLGTTALLWHRLSVTARQSSMPLSKNDCHVMKVTAFNIQALASWMLGVQLPGV